VFNKRLANLISCEKLFQELIIYAKIDLLGTSVFDMAILRQSIAVFAYIKDMEIVIIISSNSGV
jgi:hypothetical protein